jgi:hypothetical protein
MFKKLTHSDLESKVMLLRNAKVILDSDVVVIHGVETKREFKALKNKSDRFNEQNILNLSANNWNAMNSKFAYSLSAGGRVAHPKAFAEKGLYMLDTIQKRNKAIQNSISISKLFAIFIKPSHNIQAIISLENKTEKFSFYQLFGKGEFLFNIN